MKRIIQLIAMPIYLLLVLMVGIFQPSTKVQSVELNQVTRESKAVNTVFLPFIMKGSCQPGIGTKIGFGEIATGSIDFMVETDKYWFCGLVGDVIRIDMSRTSGDITPEVNIYRPNGTRLCNSYTSGHGLSVECTLDVSGTFSILAGDWNIDDTGGYDIYLQRLNNPGNPTSFNYGEVIPASITSIVEHDTYTFAGTVGDVIRIDMSRTSSDITPEVDIYRPDGTRLCTSYTSGHGLSVECTLDVSGTFSILAGDWNIDDTGGYDIYLQRLNNPGNPTSFNYGEVIPASITSIVEHDTYTFAGTVGDVIRIDMSRTSGDITPEVDIYRPDGTRLCTSYTSGHGLSVECTLDVSGTFSILAGDWNIDDTGGYDIYLQRLNNPGNPTSFNYSEVIPASITSIVEHDTYTFAGTVGDVIRIDMSRTSGDITPEVDIYRPDGTRLCTSYTSGHGLSVECTLDVSGTFSILAGDWNIDDTGGYDIYLQRLNNPGNPTSFNYGEVIPASITSIVEHDTYTFAGTVGDVIRIDMSRTSGDITPEVDIYRPDGTRLCTSYTSGHGLSVECTLDVSGTFSILAGDWNIDDTGGYDIYLQRLNNPGNPTSFNYSEVIPASITSIVEHDTYTFAGTVGDVIRIDMSRTSGDITPEVDIYRPDGTRLCTSYTSGHGLSVECTLDVSGTFSILAGDWNIDDTGGYDIYLQRFNNPGNPTSFNYGEVIPASITSIVEHDTYTFAGTVGDVIRIDMSRTSGDITPEVDIYRPNGTPLCSDYSSGSSLSVECTLDVSGTFSILAGDWSINDTGFYAISLTKTN